MAPRSRRKWLVPEVIQTSAMDCGPAALKAALDGFGVGVDYDGVRELCETNVDGTSLDVLASVGAKLGLRTHSIVVARDVALLPEARCLPAIIVISRADGLLHFVLVWRKVGPFLQIMDPASGRRWVRRQSLESTLPEFSTPVSAVRWRKWAQSQDGLAPLRARLRRIGCSEPELRARLDEAEKDASWRSFARLDAASRLVVTLLEQQLIRPGRAAVSLLVDLAAERPESAAFTIPPHCYWVTEDPGCTDGLLARGTVVLHFAGVAEAEATARSESRTASSRGSEPAVAERRFEDGVLGEQSVAWTTAGMRDAVARQLEKPRLSPFRFFASLLSHEARGSLALVLLALVISAVVVPLEAVLLQGLLSLDAEVSLNYQRVAGLFALVALLVLGLSSDWWALRAIQGLAQRLEARFRVAFLWQLPRLEDNYIRSRPTSDLADRANSLHVVRMLPIIWANMLREGLALVSTAAALIWLHPPGAWVIVAACGSSVLLARLAQRSLAELNIKLYAQATDLNNFYLNALLGSTAIAAHSAERTMAEAFEQRLVGWARSARATFRRESWAQALQSVIGAGCSIALVWLLIGDKAHPAKLLLVAYWALRIPEHARQLDFGLVIQRSLKGALLRLVSPLSVRLESQGPREDSATPSRGTSPQDAAKAGLSATLDCVTVSREDRPVLTGLCLGISPGEHLAVVGPSGSGKSTFVALLMGWVRATQGRVQIDGQPISHVDRCRFTSETVWIDPAVQLWGRSLLDNLVFGEGDGPPVDIAEAVTTADLAEVIDGLPEGLSSNLGENGCRLSGGQGQRVRVSRALMRSRPRLVILDEPFRGLERSRRKKLLARLRERWRDATLILVSHDIDATRDFERVLVLDEGRLLEDDHPETLLQRHDGFYRSLLDAERSLELDVWSDRRWRRVVVGDQRLEPA